jgi:hypothetical protein
VNEQVTLRRENVELERRPVDRAVTAADEALVRERTIEAVQHDEEAVASKEARMTEEIALRKNVEQQTETASDTVRRTEVEVEVEVEERGRQSVRPRSSATNVFFDPIRPRLYVSCGEEVVTSSRGPALAQNTAAPLNSQMNTPDWGSPALRTPDRHRPESRPQPGWLRSEGGHLGPGLHRLCVEGRQLRLCKVVSWAMWRPTDLCNAPQTNQGVCIRQAAMSERHSGNAYAKASAAECRAAN